MRNVWVQTDYPYATWVADLRSVTAQPDKVLDTVLAILDAGERHRVFMPVELPALGYRRGQSGELAGLVAAQWTDHHVIDAFAFTGAAMAPGAPTSSTVEAEVAWFDRDDAVVVARTVDLGEVLHSLEPVPGAIGRRFRERYPPVRITGPRLPYAGEPPELAAWDPDDPIEIRIAVHSDIWMPYVFGSVHPLADHKRHFDNRVLANIHTPRLNAFLRDVAAVVEGAGGDWQLDREPDDTNLDALRWLDERGVNLGAPPPALFPPEAFDAPWR
jgi:hypothetical protein